jgi:hypothetical protein
MTKQEYAQELCKAKYDQYDLKIPFEKLKWGGDLVESVLNTGEIELVDRLVEFTLCSLHSYYFIDRYSRTLDPIKGPIPFKLFDFQKKALNDYQIHKRNIFRKCRQIGASVLSGSYALWLATFNKGQMIKIISLTQRDALEFKEKTIDINYEDLPGFLKSKVTRDGNNKTKLKFVNGSQLVVLPTSKQAGRGGTPSLLVIDEAAFNPWMDDIWKAVEPSLDRGGSIIVISTTNGVGNWYHQVYTKAEQGLNSFNPIFVPWWKFPGRDNPWLEDIITEKIPTDKVEDFVNQKQLEQLGYQGPIASAPWLYKKKADAKQEKDFLQEILADFLGSGDSLIPPKTIVELIETVRDPIWEDTLPESDELIHGLWCWKEAAPEHTYMLTCDTATGHGKDYSAIQVIDCDAKEQVAEYKGQVPTDECGEIVKKIGNYYNFAYVVIECNNPGPATFNEVYRSKTDPYVNCYITMKKGQPWGWDTTAKSRQQMIDDFFKDVTNLRTKIYSKRLLEEMKTFSWQTSGKCEANKGYNDDLVITWSIYCHLLEYAFGSVPIGLFSNKKEVRYNQANIIDYEWEEKDSKYKEMFGVDMKEYFWLQGMPLPEGYIKWRKHMEEGDD